MAILPVAAYAVDFVQSVQIVSEQQSFTLLEQTSSLVLSNRFLTGEIDRIENQGRDPDFREHCANNLDELLSRCDEHMRGFRRAFAFSEDVRRVFSRFHTIRERSSPELISDSLDFAFIYGCLTDISSRIVLLTGHYFSELKLFFQNLDRAIERFNRTNPNLSFCSKLLYSWKWYRLPPSYSFPFKHPISPLPDEFCLAQYPNLAEVLDRFGYTEGREGNVFFSRDLRVHEDMICASFRRLYRRGDE